ncbi:molecular chaperone DnaK (HSP70) [Catenuloplanes nepalensis]|uniref:Molecular chaperone DnaK (HSP70) n=1 Tax=Catenuloplanes nepalensis TaxID=587533 RepID=A0ABT9MQ18_9ACTN|nr:hypothetical protein [Catenuloplanes nepalensis]MDP9793176.1 molecular chaperone DnaK (HSP70) [Catenuloplanes nepalensis]
MYDFGGGPFEATLLTRTPTGFSVTATVTEISATRDASTAAGSCRAA